MNSLIGISGRIGSGKDTIGSIIQYLTSKKYLAVGDAYSYDSYLAEKASPTGTDWHSPYKIKKFAGKLKDIVCLLLGCTREQLEDREFKDKELGEEWWYFRYSTSFTKGERLEFLGCENLVTSNQHHLVKLTPRLLLQDVGTNAIRNRVHPNTWVNALFADYKYGLPSFNLTDVSSRDIIRMGVDKAIKKFPHTVTGNSNWIVTDVRFPNEVQAIKDRGGIVIRVERDDLLRLGYLDKNAHTSETALDSYKDFDYVITNNGSIEDLINKLKTIINVH